jgi:hypothetical protein
LFPAIYNKIIDMETDNLFLRAFIRQTMSEGYEQLEKELLMTEQAANKSAGAIEEQSSASENENMINTKKISKEEN